MRWLAWVMMSVPSIAAEHYVSASAVGGGDGTSGNPWTLTEMCAHPVAVQPGDTIWLRGGTYSGSFLCELEGTAQAQITVRGYPSERPIIDGGSSNDITFGIIKLGGGGGYTTYRDFEVINSNTVRIDPTPARPEGVSSFSVGTKIINLTVHDCGQGISMWSAGPDTEAYGNVVYHSGSYVTALGRGSGHNIYTQNLTGSKLFSNNIVFMGFYMGIHAYGSSGAGLNNITIEDNIVFGHGIPAIAGVLDNNMLAGGAELTNNVQILRNQVYSPSSGFTGGMGINPCYNTGCVDLVMNDNYFAHDANWAVNSEAGTADVDEAIGNTMIGDIGAQVQGYAPPQTNSYFTSGPPNVNHQVVLPNQYEAGRAALAVFNWENDPSTTVDLSGVLNIGDPFEIRNVQNLFGTPLVTGIYNGNPVTVSLAVETNLEPMIGTVPVNPISMLPQFGAFLIRRRQVFRDPTTVSLKSVAGTVTALIEWGYKYGSGAITYDGPRQTLVCATSCQATIPQSIGPVYYRVTFYGSGGAELASGGGMKAVAN